MTCRSARTRPPSGPPNGLSKSDLAVPHVVFGVELPEEDVAEDPYGAPRRRDIGAGESHHAVGIAAA